MIVIGTDGKLELFDSYSRHPFEDGRKPKAVNSCGLTSNASGRYQQMLKDWPHYRDLLKLPDYGPISRDRLALQHIKNVRGAAWRSLWPLRCCDCQVPQHLGEPTGSGAWLARTPAGGLGGAVHSCRRGDGMKRPG